MLQFKNLQEAIQYFKSEDKCRDLLAKMRWADGVVVCPKCGQRGAYQYADMKHYKCKSQTCKNRFSITVGTMFEGTKLPLSKWFTAIYLISAHKKGISSHQLGRDLGIGQKAAWFVNHRIREMIADKQPTWLGNIVEVDETFVGGKMKNKSNKKQKAFRELNGYSSTAHLTSVMGFVQRDGKAVLNVIPDRFRDSYKDMIKKQVTADATIITDSHLGFRGLEKDFTAHETVNHNINEYARGAIHTNSVEGLFSHFKRSIIGCYHQVSPKHLHRYCIETTYRYNTRKVKDNQRFMEVLSNTSGRLKYKELIAKK